ncbi:hypothetical protein SLG_21980 [Sphingobium sp. SYK-6]|uniref:hypothetical protein n=1 Tax=Sphingobium sp. (strain NBRC 103272 / SYK-6) TaxID=627192 RepID=UPI00022770C1|nr:hypothetical protein [Sphingobium sp. SYK-6]BAK66873.1 hypothetical protein SLG_21980 [Sphingobium sp. SYK-6]
MPDTFAASFIEHGHDRVLEEIHRASWKTVMRWIHDLPDEIIEAREEHLRRTKWPNGRPGPKRRRYVMGQTLTSKRRGA